MSDECYNSGPFQLIEEFNKWELKSLIFSIVNLLKRRSSAHVFPDISQNLHSILISRLSSGLPMDLGIRSRPAVNKPTLHLFSISPNSQRFFQTSKDVIWISVCGLNNLSNMSSFRSFVQRKTIDSIIIQAKQSICIVLVDVSFEWAFYYEMAAFQLVNQHYGCKNYPDSLFVATSGSSATVKIAPDPFAPFQV